VEDFMARLYFLVAAACLAACSNMNGDVAAAGDTAQDAASAAAGAISARTSTGASEFVNAAAISDAYEIKSSDMALQRSQSDAVKAFAQEMVTAHTATTNELKPLAQAAGVMPPADVDSRRRSMLENLQNASADDFDDRYIDQQTAAHNEALTLLRTYASEGDNAQLKAFAAKTAPAVERHLAMVKDLDKSAADDAAK
jgi:putative membrane protein